MPSLPSYKDLPIWQRSMQLVVDVYQMTSRLPAAERVGLGSSIQQASTAVPTLLATGMRRGKTGFRNACLDSRESLAELETLLIIVQQVYPSVGLGDVMSQLSDLDQALTMTIKRLSSDTPAKQPPRKV